MTPTHCSAVLRGWISELTTGDRKRLQLWGIPSKLLNVADVEVSRHLLCATVRFWKPAHHVFCFRKTELTPTWEEVRRICGLSRLLGPTVFMRWDGYGLVLSQLTGLSIVDYKQRQICVDGSVPMLCLGYFNQVTWGRAGLGDDLWL